MVQAGAEVLRCRRLVLRRPTPLDVESILAIHQDPLAVGHNPSDALTDRCEADALFRRWDQHWARHGFGYWVIRRHESELQLGFCGLKLMTLRGEDVLNLLYRLHPSTWGQGLASEAATAVVGWAATHQAGYRVVARVRPTNLASHRVALKAGLVRAPEFDGPGSDGVDCLYVSEPTRHCAGE